LAFAFQPRDEFVGRYHVFAQFARGGMAELYVGRLVGAARVEKLVVIKRMLPHLVDDPEHVAMFENEARIATRLNHPNVCQTYDFDEADGQQFLVMEFLRGLPWSEVIEFLPGAELPRLRFLDGVVKLLDFGVSKDITAETATRVGMIKGKLPYMAPEQIRGDSVDGRADVFSLGVMLWEALASARLFSRGSDFQIWKAITEGAIPPLPSTPITAHLEPVVLHALARDRDARTPTARAFADELRAALAPFGTPMTQQEIEAAVAAWMEPSLARDRRELANAISTLRHQDSEPVRTSQPRVRNTPSATPSPVAQPRAAVTEVHDLVDPAAESSITFATPLDDSFLDDQRAVTRTVPEVRPSSMQLRDVTLHVATRPTTSPIYQRPVSETADDMSEAVTAPRRFVAGAPAPVIRVSTPVASDRSGPGLRWVIPLIVVSIVIGIVAALVLGRAEPLEEPRQGGLDGSGSDP
jgi:serine/threonine protein kinase